MKTPRTETIHACKMPRPRARWLHRVFVCDCGCLWRVILDWSWEPPGWMWEQIK